MSESVKALGDFTRRQPRIAAGWHERCSQPEEGIGSDNTSLTGTVQSPPIQTRRRVNNMSKKKLFADRRTETMHRFVVAEEIGQ